MNKIWIRELLIGPSLVLVLGLTACTTVPRGDETPQQVEAASPNLPATPTRPDLMSSSKPDLTALSLPPSQEATRLPPQALLLPGTGRFVDSDRADKRSSPESTSTVTAAAGGVTLNFEGVSIRDVIKVIFDTLKENYVIDPQVQGEVTVQTSRPLTQEQLLPTLETLLRANNSVLIHEGGVYHILPAAGALQQGHFRPRLGSRGVGYGVRIIPLNYVSAIEMQTILTPLLPEGAILRVDPARNLLILVGTAQELNSAQETVDTFDVNWIKGMSIGMFRLRNADSQTVATELNQLLGPESGTPIAGLVRLIALTKLNAVLVISTHRDYLQEVGTWIERLDGIGGERLYVYQVQHSRADYMAELLNGLFNLGGGRGPGRGGELAPGLRPGQASSSGIGGGLSGTKGGSSSSWKSGVSLGSSGKGGSSGSTVSAGNTGLAGGSLLGGGGSGANTTAGNPHTGAGGVSSLGAGGPSAGMEEVRIVADPDNNALLIWATYQNYERILSTLEKIDVSPRQVLIEATFVEVSLTGALEYGVQWFFYNHLGKYEGVGSLGLPKDYNVTTALEKPSPAQFSYAIADSANAVRALLRALAADSMVKVLSSPQVMVLDNQQATIEVGQQTPIPQGTTTVNNVTTSGGIDYKPTGVHLEVLPRINAGGMVSMDIKQVVSEPGNLVEVGKSGDTISSAREFLQREINSKVVVRDGQTLVLGGLIRETGSDDHKGLPFLYQVPVLGSLFGRTERKTGRTELIVLITPRVVNDNQEASRVTEEIRQKMRAVQPLLLLKNAH